MRYGEGEGDGEELLDDFESGMTGATSSTVETWIGDDGSVVWLMKERITSTTRAGGMGFTK
jgi:hypothetical protein